MKVQIKEMCRQRGFYPCGYHYVKDLKNGYRGILDITYYAYSDGRAIYVNLGINNNEIDQIHKEIFGIQSNNTKDMMLLLMSNIGYLYQDNPHYVSWYVDDTSDIIEVINTIFGIIDDIYPSFFEQYSNTEALIHAYENHNGKPLPIVSDAVYKTLPILYVLNKQEERGLDYILNHLSGQERLSPYDLVYAEGYNSLLDTSLLATIEPGELFSFIPSSGLKHYFQFIAKDTTANGSDVIRIFKTTYPQDTNPTTKEIVEDDVECYMHTMVSWGLYLGLWTRNGIDGNIGRMDITFRRSKDYGRFPLFEKRISSNWEVWTINQPKQDVGILPKEYYSADIGDIGSPTMVLRRINEGFFPSPWYPLFANDY